MSVGVVTMQLELHEVRAATCIAVACAHGLPFYQPTRVLLNKTPTRLREHNCLAKDGPLHSYGGCDGVVVSFLYSGVICVGVAHVYAKRVHRLLPRVFILSAER